MYVSEPPALRVCVCVCACMTIVVFAVHRQQSADRAQDVQDPNVVDPFSTNPSGNIFTADLSGRVSNTCLFISVSTGTVFTQLKQNQNFDARPGTNWTVF